MAETMVRTQVYLPRAVYEKLRQRAEKHGLTMAEQIREALDDYVFWIKQEEKVPPFDPKEWFELIDKIGFDGPPDMAENHDKYLYGDPHGEERLARQANFAKPQPPVSSALHERQKAYRVKKRRATKKTRKQK